ncbi:hypothetical protein FRC08_000162 [Ceratobasidium sp. 394]|nr:hypothetical protein FRC08_000162 [Ceratobasidium sp. 394]
MEVPNVPEAPQPPSTPEPVTPASQPIPPKTYGYVSVKPHPNAARVFCWEDPELVDRPVNPLDRPELFEIGEWLAELPISNTNRARYFEIERHKKDLPWEKLNEYYTSVDTLPHGPDWTHKHMVIKTEEGEEVLDLWKRCTVSSTESLIGDPRFRNHMKYAPEEHTRVTPDGRTVHVRSGMETGAWWWRMQDTLGGDATIAPIILATDATQLSLFSGNKKAWPVYLSIGNISKDIRRCSSERAMILVGYIPIPDLSFISDIEAWREKQWEVYHASMREILSSLKQASARGVEMVCADGGVRRVYPIVAAHMADWEEQCTAACTQKTRCPICDVPLHGRGDGQGELRTTMQTLEALQHNAWGYTMTRQKLGLRPVQPYWAILPFATGHSSFVPDLLHQMHKGMFQDHILHRWMHILGAGTINNRLMGMPRFPGLRHFKNGILSFINSQWTGTESKAVAKVFLPAVAGSQPSEAVAATRCLMDFMYRAHLPQLDDDDLDQLDSDLARFHDLKHIFVSHGGVKDWDAIPKLHMLNHYTYLIREFGTTDGYNTETSEWLRIDCVKVFYRASNKVDPTEQMITNLQQREAWAIQRIRLEDQNLIPKRRRSCQASEESEEPEGVQRNERDGDYEDTMDEEEEEDVEEEAEINRTHGQASAHKQRHNSVEYHPNPTIIHAKRPTKPSVSGHDIINRHHAPDFIDAVKTYISGLPNAEEHAQILNEDFRFSVWTRLSLVHDPLPSAPLVGCRTDLVRARPAAPCRRLNRRREDAFDTVLLEVDPQSHGIHRYCAARVRVIFQLPTFCRELTSKPLAFVELFGQFTTPKHSPHGLSQTSQTLRNSRCVTQVVPVSKIRMACHLVPRYASYHPSSPITLSVDLLSNSSLFFLNHYVSYYFFSLLDYWRNGYQR